MDLVVITIQLAKISSFNFLLIRNSYWFSHSPFPISIIILNQQKIILLKLLIMFMLYLKT